MSRAPVEHVKTLMIRNVLQGLKAHGGVLRNIITSHSAVSQRASRDSYVTFRLPDAQARSALAGAGLGGMAHPALMAEYYVT
eukprot:1178255-Prorocentrum_minimum.AAC.1